MAVKPSECIALTGAEQRELVSLEAEVDQLLKKNYRTRGNTIYWPVPGDASPRVIQRLITRYQDAGWKVEEGDGRQETYLKFTG